MKNDISLRVDLPDAGLIEVHVDRLGQLDEAHVGSLGKRAGRK
jgi:hypothetical protein